MESWEGTWWKETPKNRVKAEARAVLISEQMENGAFDYLKWFPDGNRAHLFRTQPKHKVDLQKIRAAYNEWILDKKPPFIRKSLELKYHGHFTAYILPLHGDVYLHLYSVSHIRDLRLHLVDEKGLSLKTAKNVIGATLRAFFRDVKAAGKIERNPFDGLPARWWPKTVPPEPDPFTEGERDKILAYLYSRYWAKWPSGFLFAYIQFWTGTRPSEVTDRRDRDYDPRNGNLSITSSRTYGETGAPKTAGSRRIITLLPPVREYLNMVRPLHVRPDDYLLTNQNGGPIDQKEYAERHFWPALQELKIRHRDFYATRDTFISVMLSHGEPGKRVAEHCGTSLAMIEKSYGKWIRGNEGFGQAALSAAKNPSEPKPLPKPSTTEKLQAKETVVISSTLVQEEMVRGRGFEPLRPFGH
jgi:integrase